MLPEFCRIRLVVLIGVLLVAVQAGCAGFVPAKGGIQPIQIAKGVYMLPGANEEIDASNLGRIGNAGFIVGDRGVVVIDTGTSYLHGRDLLDAVARITDHPVKLAIITHTRQEFLFGAAAFIERGIPVLMHRKAAGLMAARCENCLKRLGRQFGEDVMRGTRLFRPDREIETSEDVGAIGRPLKILYFGHSSGPGDIAILDELGGTLFAGGLLDNQRIPDVQDGDLAGWKQALDALDRLDITTIVPGHGPPAPAQLIGTIRHYLERLEGRMQALLDAGTALSEVAEGAHLAEFQDWQQYETTHRRNASIVFLQLERKSMNSH